MKEDSSDQMSAPPLVRDCNSWPSLTREAAWRYKAVMLNVAGGNVTVGMVNANRPLAFSELVRTLGVPRSSVSRREITEEEFDAYFDAHYKSAKDAEALAGWTSAEGAILRGEDGEVEWEDDHVQDGDAPEGQPGGPQDGAPPRMLDKALAILKQASKLNASDIHFIPEGASGSVRLRIDGKISPHILQFPRRDFQAMVNTLITRARLSPDEMRREVGDSKVGVYVDSRLTEYRASFAPTVFGPSAVLRLNVNVITDVNALGFEPQQVARLLRGCEVSEGMIVVAGPTGSGKSNTMESLLVNLDDGTKIVYQIGDPVEFVVPGRYQVSVTTQLTWEKCYEKALRHNPNIISPGEVRNRVQAEQAFKGASTGHLLLTTVHADSAAGVITRFRGLGVDPYYLAKSLTVVVAQRLLGSLCRHCRVPDPARPGAYAAAPRGCPQCLGRGYFGRTAVGEILLVTPPIKRLILGNAPEEEIEAAARAEGMTMMCEAAERRVADGTTSYDELRRQLEDLSATPHDAFVIQVSAERERRDFLQIVSGGNKG